MLDTTKAKKKNTATFRQKNAVAKMLEDIIIVVDEEQRLVEYKPGHTDATVAEAIGVGANIVKGVRVTMHGKLRTHNRSETPSIKQELANAFDRDMTIRVALNDLTDRFNKLVLFLSLNRIAGVKHLEVPKNGELL
jgi:hypothetical protein